MHTQKLSYSRSVWTLWLLAVRKERLLRVSTMEKWRCFVQGCPEVGGKMFRFPITKDRAQKWKTFCQNPILDKYQLEKLHNSCQVCVKHFPVNAFTHPTSGKLLRSAVPSLFPPEPSPDSLPQSSLPALSTSAQSEDNPTIASSPTHQPPESYIELPLPLSASSPPLSSPLPFTPEPPESYIELPSTSSASLPFISSPPPLITPEPTSSASFQSFSSPPPPASTPVLPEPSTSTHSAPLSPTPGSSLYTETPKRKNRKSLLRDIGMSRCQQLTPRKRLLMGQVKKSHKEISRLRKICVQHKKDLRGLMDVTKSDFLRLFENRLSPSALLFLQSILRQGQAKPKGRRWSNEEKIMALSLFKKGPKSYRLLSNFIPLPAKSTLRTLLKTIPLHTGLNEDVLAHLGSVVKGLKNEKDKYCALLFDEMAIRPCLTYDATEDEIRGYVDQGSQGREGIAAKQALVFMIRGLRARWKQPLFFYLSHGSTPAAVLAELIKEVMAALNEIGLKVVCTVCDMGTSNVKSLQLLGANFNDPTFKFNGQRVITIFDPPHLLKSFRNLFLTHNVRVPVTVLGERRELVAKWDHLRVLAQDDAAISYLPLRLFHLTERHLAPSSYEKMRVGLATKIFSRHVAAGVHTLVGRNILGIDGLATAQFLMEVDMLFDSMNCSSKAYDEKELKQSVTSGSPHLAFWKEMEEKMELWSFVRKQVVHPPSQKGWLASIRGMRMLWKRLECEGFLHFNTQNVNQDPLENFFNVLRQNCGGNHHPNANQFQSAFKTALINNLVSNHTPGNTEEDSCSLLSNLSNLFFPEGNATIIPRDSPKVKHVSLGEFKVTSIVSISSYVGNTFLKENPCTECKEFLFKNMSSMEDLHFTFFCEGLGQGEIGPSHEFILMVRVVMDAVGAALQREGHRKNLMEIVRPVVDAKSNIGNLCCGKHEMQMKNIFIPLLASIGINKFCVEENKKMQCPRHSF